MIVSAERGCAHITLLDRLDALAIGDAFADLGGDLILIAGRPAQLHGCKAARCLDLVRLRLAQLAIACVKAPSSCAAEVEAMRAVWAGRLDGYAKAATPVTSAQV